MVESLIDNLVSAFAIRRDGTLLDVVFLKDFGPWKADQIVAQLKIEDECFVEFNANGEEVQRVRVALTQKH